MKNMLFLPDFDKFKNFVYFRPNNNIDKIL